MLTGTATVLGRKLRPLCLGHAYLLLAIGSPYLCAGGVRALRDLITAAWICSQEWDTARDQIVAGIPAEKIQKWGRELGEFDLARETAAMEDYVSVYSSTPPRGEIVTSEGIKKRRAWAVPWPLGMAWTLMERVSEDRAWSMPLSLAMAYSAAAADCSGDDSLLSEVEETKIAEGLAAIEGTDNG